MPRTTMAPRFSRGILCAVLAAACLLRAADPLDTALRNAAPGDVIIVSGVHTGPFKTYVAGTQSAPITVRGDGTAVLQGEGPSPGYGVTVRHDYYRFENLTLRDYKKGFMVAGASHGIARRVHVAGTQEEAFKIHHPTSGAGANTPSQYWLFIECSARDTGTASTGPGTGYGEGFYTGDADNNWFGGQPDTSGFVTFYNCYVTDTRNDGWDAKEGAHDLKFVNCTQDYSGALEPSPGDSLGDSGAYCRAERAQFVNLRGLALGNGGSAFKLYQQTAVDGVTYGHDMELKNVAAEDLSGALLNIQRAGMRITLYDDYELVPSGALRDTHAVADLALAPAATFSERTWPGEGGGCYASLHPARGAFGPGVNGDPLPLPPTGVAAPTSSIATGTYLGPQIVTLHTPTAGALIRYTTDGSPPSPTHGEIYLAPLTVAATTRVRAIALYTEPLPDDATVVLAPYVSSEESVTLEVLPFTYERWCATRFTAGELAAGNIATPTAAPDADGWPNLLEYAFAADPHRADRPPPLGSSTAADGEHLTVTYCRRTGAIDRTYNV